MTLEQVEQAIHDYYFFFYKKAPGVVVQEEGRLAQLWALFQRLAYERAKELKTYEEVVFEYGPAIAEDINWFEAK